MKILKISGIVAAIHVALFLLVFAIPGCHSTGKPASANVAIADNAPASAPAPATVTMSGGDLNPPLALTAAPPPPPRGFDPVAPAAPRFNPTRPGTAEALALAPPPPPPAPLLHPVAPVSSATRHTVASGESLWTIAKKYSVTPSALAKANNLTVSAVLHPGQKLLVPDGGRAAVAGPDSAPVKVGASPAAPSSLSTSAATHVIKPGETLGGIAKSYGVKVGDLEVANHITDPKTIRAGQTLKIPAGRGSTKSEPANPPLPADAGIGAAPPPPVASPSAPVDLHFTGLPSATDSPPASAPAPVIRAAPPPPPAGLPAPAVEAPVIKVEDSGAPRIQ